VREAFGMMTLMLNRYGRLVDDKREEIGYVG
jgi:hypothetical protein